MQRAYLNRAEREHIWLTWALHEPKRVANIGKPARPKIALPTTGPLAQAPMP